MLEQQNEDTILIHVDQLDEESSKALYKILSSKTYASKEHFERVPTSEERESNKWGAEDTQYFKEHINAVTYKIDNKKYQLSHAIEKVYKNNNEPFYYYITPRLLAPPGIQGSINNVEGRLFIDSTQERINAKPKSNKVIKTRRANPRSAREVQTLLKDRTLITSVLPNARSHLVKNDLDEFIELRMVIDKLPGKPLSHRDIPLNQYSKFQTLELFYSLCDDLSGIHARKVIHSDIKPENILVEGTTARLCDMDLIYKKKNRTSGKAGSPLYMAEYVWQKKRLHDELVKLNNDKRKLAKTKQDLDSFKEKYEKDEPLSEQKANYLIALSNYEKKYALYQQNLKSYKEARKTYQALTANMLPEHHDIFALLILLMQLLHKDLQAIPEQIYKNHWTGETIKVIEKKNGDCKLITPPFDANWIHEDFDFTSQEKQALIALCSPIFNPVADTNWPSLEGIKTCILGLIQNIEPDYQPLSRSLSHLKENPVAMDYHPQAIRQSIFLGPKTAGSITEWYEALPAESKEKFAQLNQSWKKGNPKHRGLKIEQLTSYNKKFTQDPVQACKDMKYIIRTFINIETEIKNLQAKSRRYLFVGCLIPPLLAVAIPMSRKMYEKIEMLTAARDHALDRLKNKKLAPLGYQEFIRFKYSGPNSHSLRRAITFNPFKKLDEIGNKIKRCFWSSSPAALSTKQKSTNQETFFAQDWTPRKLYGGG